MSLKKLFNKASGAIAGVSMLVLAGCQTTLNGDFESSRIDYGEAFPSHVFDADALRRIEGEGDRFTVLPQGRFARIGRVAIAGGGYGTGVLVGPNIVMTADHVTENRRGVTHQSSELTFYAGYHNGRAVAASRVKAIIAPETSVLGASLDGVMHSYNDVAFLVLEDNLGDRLGYERLAQSYSGLARHSGRYLGAAIGNNRNHSRRITGDFQCSFTHSLGDENVLENNCDTDKGDSGGPLYSWRFNSASGRYEREIVGVISTKTRTGGTAYSVVGRAVPRMR